MPRLSLAKLERHLYSAADRLRQEGLDASVYKDYIFGILFLKRCSDVFDAEREKIVARKIEQGMEAHEAEGLYGENPDFYDGYPIRFSLNINGELPGLFRSALFSGDFNRHILEQLQSGKLQ